MTPKNQGLEWFRPVWRRALVVGFCVAWTAFEWLYSKDQMWGMITSVAAAYSVWLFFIDFDKRVGPPPGQTPKA